MAVVETAAASAARRRLRLVSPATREELGEIDVAHAAQVAAVVARARAAQHEWAERPLVERTRILERTLGILVARRAECAAAITRETGKPEAEALAAEIFPVCDGLRYTARRSKRLLAGQRLPVRLFPTRSLRLEWRPFGVVGVVTGWSHPFLLALLPAAHALVAGNAVVHKPSERTPFSSRFAAELLSDGGLPEGLFTCLEGDGPTGAALVEADVDKVAFVGSRETASAVAESCGRRLISCSVVAGASSAAIVCADADVERAARGLAWSAFANAGQGGFATRCAYVVDAVGDALQRRLVEQVSALRQGPGGESDVGPVLAPGQLEALERGVADALERGARLLAGGRRNPEWPGLYFEPTLLADVSPDAALLCDPLPGPVLALLRVANEEDALRLASAAPAGLATAVWTRDRGQGVRLAPRLAPSAVLVNDALPLWTLAEAPYGAGGLGPLGGELGLRSFGRAQPILVDRAGGRSRLLGFPYTARTVRALERRMRWLWGTPLGRLLS